MKSQGSQGVFCAANPPNVIKYRRSDGAGTYIAVWATLIDAGREKVQVRALKEIFLLHNPHNPKNLTLLR